MYLAIFNVEKTKYSFFRKPIKKDDVLLRLPKLVINNCECKEKNLSSSSGFY